MTQEQALVAGLFNAFLWGSWAIFIKKLGDYPLDAFFVMLYVFSFVLVWGIALVVLGGHVFVEIGDVWQQQPALVVGTLAAGATYLLGVRITMSLFSTLGLSLTAPIQTFMNLGVGTLLAAWVGGVPPGISPLDIGIVCGIFLLASAATVWAREIQNRARRTENPRQFSTSRVMMACTLLKVALASAVVTAYPLGLAFALHSPERDFGLTPLPYMALLATGSLATALLVSGGVLTARGQWPLLFHAQGKYHCYAAMTAGAHYGGNIINAFASGVLTTAVSWPLGTTSQLWTYFWGLVSGEFKGAPRQSYVLLLASGVLFIVGILFLRWTLVKAD